MKAAKICGIMASAVLLYVLSTGPMTAWYHWENEKDRREWLDDNFKTANRAQTFLKRVTPVYAPLIWISGRSRICGDALVWYQALWTPNDPIVF